MNKQKRAMTAKELIAKSKKRQANQRRYAMTSPISNKALRMDRILQTQYPHSAGSSEISKSILEQAGFEFDIISCIHKSNPPIFWVIDYGYSYSANKEKIVIHYGNNPL